MPEHDHAVEAVRDIVLVVDDSPETLRFLTDALERFGWTVLVATDGAMALGMLEHITPDVILMDAIMPDMDGFEATRRLKQNTTFSTIPVIFMTGLTETEHVVKGFAAGGVDYVGKPIVPDELIARVRVHLANARAAMSARSALDTAGRYLLAADRGGSILWSTPQANRLLQAATAAGQAFALPPQITSWLGSGASGIVPSGAIVSGDKTLQINFLGKTGEDEYLFRLTHQDAKGAEAAFRREFQLTAREAEVLLWIAHGKSNRDIGDILGLSPRTVNKHLEQIYTKLGVENRASAAVLALRALDES